MAGYTRNDTAGNIADGNVISAAPLDGEFDAIQDAFALSTGHTHDGSTTGDGGPISKLGPSQQLEQTASTLATTTDITVATNKFIQFRDSGLKILSSADGQLDIDADTELEIVAPTVDIDASTAVTIDTATLTITGAANITGDLDVDDININGGAITSTNTNGDITISPNGTGTVIIDTDLDVDNININGNSITSTNSDGNIGIVPNGDGKVNIDGDGSSGGVSVSDGLVDIRTGTGSRSQVKFYCESSNAHAQTVQPQPHSAGVTNTLTLPAGSDQEIVGTSATQTLTNKTLTSAVLNDTISGTSIKDEDDMSSNSANHLATQQSIKAYVDSTTGAISTDLSSDSSPQLGANLDTNSHNILIDDAHFIGDENGNEQLIFKTTSSAVNQIDITNAATGGHPLIQASGDDTNINLKLDGKGSGVVNVVDDLTVGGDLTVNGTTTTVATTNTVISDGRIELANGTTGSPTNDTGIVIERGSADNAFIGFDESEDKFKVGTGSFTGATSDANLTIATGTMVANLEGNVTGNVTGTIQNGSGGDPYTFPASDGSNGQLLQTNGSGALSFTNAVNPYPQVITLLTSGTSYTIPSDAKAILIKASGGGGSGGSSQFSGNHTTNGNTGGQTTVSNSTLGINMVVKGGNSGRGSTGGTATVLTGDSGLNGVIRAGGAAGGHPGMNNFDISCSFGGNGNLGFVYLTGTNLGGEVLTYSIGAGGAGATAGSTTSAPGQNGYIEITVW